MNERRATLGGKETANRNPERVALIASDLAVRAALLGAFGAIHYGAYHPIAIAPTDGDTSRPMEEVAVGGPLCESGDIFTQEEGGFEMKSFLRSRNEWRIRRLTATQRGARRRER